ncbi:putative Asp/Glu racemase [Suillus discolor]|uniref:Asp/Glu racemase n=1 Tax=Suillus discolor TaxID=1912936 RepID=A0A9P7EYB0_9AGAM|nr:putative Asp/Glu racemase [Suillus discolor]KAG2094876.1 putative Asp/Glu racemase [Suillus discolor]
MPKQIRLGILTPSSNTALEPLTYQIVSSIPNVSVHFSRFPVTAISLSPEGLAQFDHSVIAQAAKLLAHAEVDMIGWSGTAAGWIGFEDDEKLCQAITKATGIPATTSVLALNKALGIFKVKKLGLVTPYLDDVQERIVKNYNAIGMGVTSETERHLRVVKNTDVALIGEDVLETLVGQVVEGGADAVSTFCTNLIAAHKVELWEAKYGVPVLDTVTTVTWDMLRQCGVDTKAIKGWGRIFQEA